MHVLRGEILAQLGQPEAAQAAFERALLLSPDSPRAHAGLGRVHLQMGRAHAAVRAFEQAVHAEPEAAVQHALLAAALLGSGDSERAARHAAIARRDPQARALVTELERLHPGLGAAPARGSR
jgi:tetratricopeptide (TPR) repeat protein